MGKSVGPLIFPYLISFPNIIFLGSTEEEESSSAAMISMWKVREMVDKATNLVMNYTETEAKVRDATNDDPWGPSGNQMQEVASYTFTYEQFPEASIC